MRWRGAVGIVVASSGFNCSSPANTVSDAGSDAAASPDAVAIVEASGLVIENSDAGPIAGAKVCIIDDSVGPCAVTDGTGHFTIALPPLASPLDIAFNFTAAGHLGITDLVHETQSGVSWPGQVPLRDDAAATTFLTKAGFTYPAPGTAFILFAVFRGGGGGGGGLTASISPTSGTGPVYLDATGTPDPALTATTSGGGVLFGSLTPGKIEITVSPPCTVYRFDSFWTETKPGTVAGQTIAGSMTQMSMICVD